METRPHSDGEGGGNVEARCIRFHCPDYRAVGVHLEMHRCHLVMWAAFEGADVNRNAVAKYADMRDMSLAALVTTPQPPNSFASLVQSGAFKSYSGRRAVE